MNSLWKFDLDAIRWVHVQGNSPWLDPVFFVISSTGLGWVQILIILLTTVRWNNLKRGMWSRMNLTTPLLVSYAVTGLLNAAIKKGIPRERPSNLDWAHPQETFFYNSFSSGHTATSFGLATTLWWLTRGTPFAWVGRAGWVWAALVGFSRVYRGVHWPTDVVSGAMVGIVFGTATAWWWSRRVARGS